MTILTTRPNATNLNSNTLDATQGAAITGAASAWQALADESDSTYVQLSSNDHLILDFAEPSIPAGSAVKQGRLRGRMVKVASGAAPLTLDWKMTDPATTGTNIHAERLLSVPWTLTQTINVLIDENTAPHVAPTSIRTDITARTEPSFVQVFGLWFDTVYVTQPVVTVTAPADPTNFDSTPSAAWTTSLDTDGGIQTHFEVKFFNAATYGGGVFSPTTSTPTATSGVTASGWANWAPTTALPNATYRAYVRVAQTVNGAQHWSGWSFKQFVLGASSPATPGMGVTPEPAQARIRINLSSNAGAATTTDYEVQYDDRAGTWQSVRTSEPGGIVTASGGAGTTYDFEAPNGQTRSYRARSRHIYYTPGGLLEGITVSAWTTTSTASWTGTVWWIKHPDPTLNMQVEVRSQPTTTRTARRGMFQPLARAFPIAVQDLRQTAEGEIVFRFDTDTERNDFTDVIATGDSVLIQAPPGIFDWPDRWCALGDHTRERAVEQDGEWTFDTLSFTEVERPVP